MIVTFFGHSAYVGNKSDEEKLLSLLEEVIKGECVEFFLGGYGDFDIFAYTCAKKYKTAHNNAVLSYVTPYLDRAPFLEYDRIVYPPIETVPKKFAISHRNRWMAERTDVVISYVTASFGGAYDACKYAQKKGKTIYNLAL